MAPLVILIGFILVSYIFVRVEDNKIKKSKCSNYLTGRIRFTKKVSGNLIEVEHYKRNKTFYKPATIKEIRYIKSLK